MMPTFTPEEVELLEQELTDVEKERDQLQHEASSLRKELAAANKGSQRYAKQLDRMQEELEQARAENALLKANLGEAVDALREIVVGWGNEDITQESLDGISRQYLIEWYVESYMKAKQTLAKIKTKIGSKDVS